MGFSEYHPAVAFDDVSDVDGGLDMSGHYGSGVAGAEARPSGDGTEAPVAILRRARSRRIRVPSRVLGAGTDTTRRTFFAPAVLGDDDAPIELPLYGALYQQFSEKLPEPKLVRVDDQESYAEFRKARREPYMAQIDARLAALERAFAAHTADNHGGGRLDELEAAFRRHLAEATAGGEKIPLPTAGVRSECWQDGPEILVTICLSDGDEPRYLTSGTPVTRHADEVVHCALEAGVDSDDLLAVGPVMIQVIGAAKLVEQLAVAADEIIDSCSGTGTVALVSAADPSLTAAMALLQRCQQGDWRACKEARRMQNTHGELVSDAAQRLLQAQRVIGRRM